jgi:hypothetical protein
MSIVSLALGLVILLNDKGPTVGAEGFVHLMPLAIAILLFAWLSTVWGTDLAMKALRMLDFRILGRPRDEESYVGIAYSDDFWSFRNDLAWDRGFLTARPDGLVFRGHVTEFALPAHAIHGIRLATTKGVGALGTPRIFIDWVSPDGATSTLSLDGRAIKAFQRETRANLALADKIRDALSKPAETPISAQWPPALNPTGFLSMEDLRLSGADRMAGLAGGFGLGALVLVAEMILLLSMGVADSVVAPFVSISFALAFMVGVGITLNQRIRQKADKASVTVAVDSRPISDRRVSPHTDTQEQRT